MGTMNLPSDLSVNAQGYVSLAQVGLPHNCVRDTQIASDAAIGVFKTVHMVIARATQPGGSDVAAESRVVHVVGAAHGAVVLGVDVGVDVAPDGGDMGYSVDVQRSTGGGPYTSLLAAPAVIDAGVSDRSVVGPTVSSPALAAGDLVRVVVEPSGSTGTQGQGVAVLVRIAEAAA